MEIVLQGVATEKVPGGKLVRAKVDYGYSVNSVEITGDFFMHPEEKLMEIENSLRGIDREMTQEKMAERIKQAVDSHGIILVGVTEDAIARVVRAAIK